MTVPAVPDQAAEKATTVLRILQAANLTRGPSEAALADTIELWADALSVYPQSEVEEVARGFAEDPDHVTFPTLGEFLRIARAVHAANTRSVGPVDACPECDGDLYVSEVIGVEVVETHESKKRHTRKFTQPDDGDPENREYIEIPQKYKRPCSTCPAMRNRYELWRSGHFEADHVAGGGCRECYDYTAQAIKDRARKGYR